MEIDYRTGTKMSHVDALDRNPVTDEMVAVCTVSVNECEWFYTMQFQEPKVQSIIRDLQSDSPTPENRIIQLKIVDYIVN